MSNTFASSGASETRINFNRCVVVNLFGKVAEIHDGYKKRFWHTVIDLPSTKLPPIDDFERLSDGWSKVHFRVHVQYQLTVDYAKAVLTRNPANKNITQQIEEQLKSSVETESRSQIKKLKAEDFMLAEGRKNAEKKIEDMIESIFVKNQITCNASCSLETPIIEWPKESDKPQLIAGSKFFESLKTQSNEFFKRQTILDIQNTADKEDSKIKERTANLSRQTKEERLNRIEKALGRQSEENEARDLSNSEITSAGVKYQKDMAIMALEAASRSSKMSEYKDEKAFLVAEAKLLKLELKSLMAEERNNSVEATVAQELEKNEIKNIKKRMSAESVVELQKQTEILEALPKLMEYLVKNPQSIEQMKVLQIGGNVGDKDSLVGSPIAQIVQALTVLRQTMDFLSEHNDHKKGDSN